MKNFISNILAIARRAQTKLKTIGKAKFLTVGKGFHIGKGS